MKSSNYLKFREAVQFLPYSTVCRFSKLLENTSDSVQFSRIKKVYDDGRILSIKKSRIISDPASQVVFGYFFLNFLLKPTRPIRPELKRSMVVGSGTGAGSGKPIKP